MQSFYVIECLQNGIDPLGAQLSQYGWDGTTALGGAVDNSKPARMLDEIREAGETQSSACELFNANLGEFGCGECSVRSVATGQLEVEGCGRFARRSLNQRLDFDPCTSSCNSHR